MALLAEVAIDMMFYCVVCCVLCVGCPGTLFLEQVRIRCVC